jgi:50S ribosomal subunit-associated GTPase HflX
LAQQRAVIVVVGNKSDLFREDDPTHVQPSIAEEWSQQRHFHYVTASALTGDGIKELVDFLFEKVPKAHVAYVPTPTLNLGATSPPTPKQQCCRK